MILALNLCNLFHLFEIVVKLYRFEYYFPFLNGIGNLEILLSGLSS